MWAGLQWPQEIPPAIHVLFIHYILWLKGKPHFTSLTRIEQTLIWLPGALLIHLLVFIICITLEQKNISLLCIKFKDVHMWVCERVHVCVFVTLWVACFDLIYLQSKLEYVLTVPFIVQSDSAWHLSWSPKNVAGKVSFLKENHVFLFTSIISQVKCHMGKKMSQSII